jgi:hypothetical protein
MIIITSTVLDADQRETLVMALVKIMGSDHRSTITEESATEEWISALDGGDISGILHYTRLPDLDLGGLPDPIGQPRWKLWILTEFEKLKPGRLKQIINELPQRSQHRIHAEIRHLKSNPSS